MKHVIIGVGPAGVTAARTIRATRPDDEIMMISQDTHVHSRCMLHKYIAGERDERTISFVPDGFFVENRIQWLGGTTVTGIDTAAKKVQFAGGEEVYDKLLIATGADSIIPPVGALRTAENVRGMRHLTDARAVRLIAQDARKIVIIGSGLVGLDAAYGLLELGKPSTIVEMGDRILPLNLDAHAAKAYQDRFEQAGCVFKLDCKASGTRERDGRITHLELDGGEALECDLIICATGVRPATTIVQGSDIECERAIKVDHRLATSCPDVYAAGDVAGLSGIWPNAMKQGEVAGLNMCGGDAAYTDTFAIKNTIQFFGLTSLSVGKLTPEEGDTVEVREDHLCYKKVIHRDGRVLGVILQGDIAHSGFWQYLIKNKIDIRSVGKPVWDISFADFYGTEPDGGYRWAVNT